MARALMVWARKRQGLALGIGDRVPLLGKDARRGLGRVASVGVTWLVLGELRPSLLLTLLSRLSQVAHPILP